MGDEIKDGQGTEKTTVNPASESTEQQRQVPLSELQKERAKRQELEKRLEGLNKQEKQEVIQNVAGLKIPNFSLEDVKDIMDLSPELFVKKLNDHSANLVNTVLNHVQTAMSKTQADNEVKNILNKHDFYSRAEKEDPTLYEVAMKKVAADIEKNPDRSVADIIAERAKEYSKYLVEGKNQEDATRKKDPVTPHPSAGGGGEAAHTNTSDIDFSKATVRDLKSAARNLINKIAGQDNARGKT